MISKISPLWPIPPGNLPGQNPVNPADVASFAQAMKQAQENSNQQADEKEIANERAEKEWRKKSVEIAQAQNVVQKEVQKINSEENQKIK